MTNINPSTDDEFNFSSVLASIKRRKKSFLIIAISIFFLTGVYSVKKKSVWEGTFQIVLKDNQPKSNLSSLLSARSPISLLRNQSSQNKLNTEILILQSPSVLKPIYDYVKSEYDLLGYDTSTLKFRNWKKNLIVKLEKKSNVLRISYLDKEKELIIPVLNKISEKYQDYSGKERLQTLSNTKIYLDKQVEVYKEKTSKSSKELQSFANLHKIGMINANFSSSKNNSNKKQTSISNALMLDLENKHIAAKNEVELINQKLKQLSDIDESSNLSQKISIYSKLGDPKISDLFSEEVQLIDSNLIRYKTGFNSEHPKVKNLESLKNKAFEKLKESVIGSLEAQRREAIALQKATERPQEVFSKYKDLYRTYKLDVETLSNLELERNINELSLAKGAVPWELISNPLLFDKPVAPNRARLVLTGLFISLALSTLFVRLKDKNSMLIYDKKDVQKFLIYEELFDFTNIEQSKIKEIIYSIIRQYFDKENIFLFTLGKFDSNSSEKVLKIIKDKNNGIKITENIDAINDSSKILILISLDNLYKKDLTYISKFLSFIKEKEIFLVYI